MIPSGRWNDTGTKESPPQCRHPSSGNLAAISEATEPVEEGFRLWQTEEKDEESETSYKAGPVTFIGVPVNGEPIMALLLSYQLGQWMLECVRLQRGLEEFEGRSKTDIARIDKEIFGLLHLLNYMEAISISHDNAFLKAGILPEYVEVGRRCSLGSKKGLCAITTAFQDSENGLHRMSTKEPSEARGGDKWAMVLFKKKSTDERKLSSNEVVSHSATREKDDSQILEEAKHKDKLYLARSALQRAEKAQKNHRPCYKDEFSKFEERHALLPAAELTSIFGPLWVQHGQRLTCELCDADKAFTEAEKRVLDANLFTVSHFLIDPAANLHLDNDDIDALNVHRDNDHIIKWISVKGGMVTAPSCYTTVTSDAESSIDDGVALKRTTSRRTSIKSAEDQ
ncbi:hypothetical protein G6011_05472 [Alternaria panax]|uniref:Uncharacterized protein n=1 Tax=Alternaria panax TaxID=48097 RepID=A0AAD4I8A1_9PLEO|nr:hypothetical protein G6011_05472 [Alternaria panax]